MIPSGSVSAPFPDGEVPAKIAEFADGRPAKLIWINDLGGVTARISADGMSGYYAKWNPRSTGLSLEREARKLVWLARTGHPTSEVVELRSVDEGELLIMRDSGATSAAFPERVAKPDTALRAIGMGLRRLHSLPVDECPFTWSVAERWADLAVVVMSFGWNYPNHDKLIFWETYGREPDEQWMAYYRTLWDAE